MDSPNISRRDILKIGGLVAAGTALTACTLKDDLLSVFINPNLQTDTQTSLPTTQIPVEKMQSKELSSSPSPKPEFNDITTENSVILHTLRRMQFGITPQMIQHAQSIGLMNYIDEQLQMQNLETNSTEEKINNLSIMKQSKEDLLKDENQGRIVREFVLSTIFRQVTNPYQIYEMMVDFWTNHFNIFLLDGFAKILKIYDDREVIRPNALKTFPDLLQASAHSPAMLYYLDQARSSRNSPNENYARELLELHTVGVDSSYTQGDIETLARELTGWSIVGPRDAKTMNLELGDFYFRSKAHDNKEKNIMGFQIPVNQGLQGGERFLDFLASHPSTAQFIAQKLSTRFISDAPPKSIVEKLAQTFLDTNGDIKSMLHTLIFSPEFISSAGLKFKRPLEYFNSTLIATQGEIEFRPRTLKLLYQGLQMLGQIPYFWQPPDGYPDYQGWWSTTSGMLNRWNIALILLSEKIPGIKIPLQDIVSDGETPADIVDLLSLQFIGMKLPDSARETLISFTSDGSLDEKIPYTAALILSSPYFQVR